MIKALEKYEHLGGTIDFVYENEAGAESTAETVIETTAGKKFVKQIEVDGSGKQVEYVVEQADGYTLVSFKGVGKFVVRLTK